MPGIFRQPPQPQQPRPSVVPTFTAAGGVTALPSAASLVITGATPVVLTPRVVLPSAASLTIAGATPAVATPRKALPSAASLTVTGAIPAVVTPRKALPSAAALVITGSAPAVSTGGGVAVLPDYAILNLRTSAPFVEAVAATAVATGGMAPRPREPLPPRPVPVTTAPTGAHLSVLTSTPAVVINDDELVLALAA